MRNVEIDKWLEYANNDLLVAKELHLQNEFVFNAVLTHCQQSVEKYLKAFLLSNDAGIIKTHDLDYLNKKCLEIDEEFSKFSDEFIWLSYSYISSRYPDNFEDISKEDAQLALRICNRVRKIYFR